MSGIDWDEVPRNRNLWKPDYREELKRSARPNLLPRPDPLGKGGPDVGAPPQDE